jgi:hypothetical protein
LFDGQFPVVLADGRTVTMDVVDIAYMLHDNYARAALPAGQSLRFLTLRVCST